MRPIDADFLKEIYSVVNGRFTAAHFRTAIDEQPILDVVPVRRGVWYKHPANGIECSECGLFGYIDGDHEYVYNFCPRCGADMREVEKNG